MKTKYRVFNNVSETTRKTMSHIHNKDTCPEVELRHALWMKGYRYRKNYKCLPGRPDICITKLKIAIFVDSDFFHGRDWEKKLKQKVKKGNNGTYWEMKIQENIDRDNRIDSELRGIGWTALHFWTSDIKKDLPGCVRTIEEAVLDVKIMNPGD